MVRRVVRVLVAFGLVVTGLGAAQVVRATVASATATAGSGLFSGVSTARVFTGTVGTTAVVVPIAGHGGSRSGRRRW